MLKRFRTRNKFSASSVDQIPHQFVAWQLFGHQLLIPIADIDRTSYFLVFGANPMASNGSLMTVPDFPNRLRELKKRGGRMVVFDPRRTETAKVADEHHFVRPGHRRRRAARDGARAPRGGPGRHRRRTSAAIESVRLAVADFTPEHAAEASRRARPTRSGGSPASSRRPTALRRTDGSGCRPRASAPSASGRSTASTSSPATSTARAGCCSPSRRSTSSARRSSGAATTTSGAAACAAYRSSAASCRSARCARRSRPPARARSTPCSRSPATRCSRRRTASGSASAFDGLDFMAAVDIYLNETTRHADVVLPPTTALERDQYDLVFHTLAVRNTARFTPPVFEKPDGAMHDWEIFREIALRTAARLDQKKPLAQGARRAGAAQPQSDDDRHRRCCSPVVVRRCGRCVRTPPASTSARCGRRCPRGCRPRTS